MPTVCVHRINSTFSFCFKVNHAQFGVCARALPHGGNIVPLALNGADQ